MDFPPEYLNKIVQIDALALLIQLPDECVDMVFADPPYNIHKSEYSDDRKSYNAWCESWINECFRILKPTGTFYLKTIWRHLEWKMPLMAKQGVFINLVPWSNASAGRNNKRHFWYSYEPIIVYGKTKKYKFNTYAQVNTNGVMRWGGYKGEFKGQVLDYWDIPFVYSGSIIHPEAILQKGTKKKAHPCQMPEALPRRAMLFSTDPGDLVFDPFTGSGTTPAVCIIENRNYSGCEIENKYQKIIDTRLEEARRIKAFNDSQLQFELKQSEFM